MREGILRRFAAPSRLRLAAAVLVCFGFCGQPCLGIGQEPAKPVPPLPEARAPLTQSECIAIALRAQPSIHIQQAAYGVATEVQKQARSYFLPQVGFSSRYTAFDRPLYEVVANPLAGQVGNVLSDSAAFFGIAREFGVAAASAVLCATEFAAV